MKNITFINAGAGSGKTHSLIEELYGHIAQGKCRGDEVLVTTFTRKAAEEIRERAFTKLLEKGLTEDAILLQNAWMGTVHAVGYRLIRKYCYLIGLSPDISELSEEDADFYFTQAISSVPSEDELDEIASLSSRFQFQSMGDYNNPVFDPQKWKEHVIGIIKEARRNRIADLSTGGLSYEKSIEFATRVFGWDDSEPADEELVIRHAEHLFRLLESLPDNRNKGRKSKGHNLCVSLLSGPLSYSLFPELHALAADILGKVDPDNIHAAELVRILDGFYRTPFFREEVTAYIRMIFSISERCLEEFMRYKRDRALVDYTDMEILFLELLDLADVQAELGDLLKLVLVDEFQDSNPVQLNIFVKLAALADHSIWVGDPKQAIYGFNGADPQLVTHVLESFYGGKEENLGIKLLKNSWRSRNDLVTFANSIFGTSLSDQAHPVRLSKENVIGEGPLFERWKEKTFKDKAETELPASETIRLIPIRTDHGRPEGGESRALGLWHFTNSFSGSGNKDHFTWHLARRIKSFTGEGLVVYDKHTETYRPLQPSDIAVLCRKTREVKAVAAELLNNGLEVAAIVDGLYDTAEYRLIINMLNFIADPSNSLSIAEILLLISTEDGITPEALLEERLEYLARAREEFGAGIAAYYDHTIQWGKNHPFISKLDSFASVSNHLSVPELMEKMVAELELDKHISGWGNDRQRKANIRQIVSYSREYDDYCLRMNIASGIAGFVNWMSSRKEKNNQAPSESRTAVNVLTYHKAKGLEWPVVIITGLDSPYDFKILERNFFSTSVEMDGITDVEEPLRGRYINFSFWPFGAKGNILGFEHTTRDTGLFKEREQVKLWEEKRLLYMGMTRARDCLILTRFKNKEQRWLDLGTNDIDITKTGVPVNEETIHDDRTEFAADYEETGYRPGIYFGKHESLPQDDPKYISPSKMKSLDKVAVSVIHDFDHRIRITGIDNEATLGNCLHDILYLQPNRTTKEKIGTIVDRHNLTGRVDMNDILEAANQLNGFIIGLKPEATHREMPLRMGKDKHVYAGSADLVLEFSDHLVLIDYKSYPGKVTDILDTSNVHYAGIYSGQLDAYASLLEAAIGKKVKRKLIYYVVMGKIVELV